MMHTCLLSSVSVFPEFRCILMYIERDANITFMSLLAIVYSHKYCIVVSKQNKDNYLDDVAENLEG